MRHTALTTTSQEEPEMDQNNAALNQTPEPTEDEGSWMSIFYSGRD